MKREREGCDGDGAFAESCCLYIVWICELDSLEVQQMPQCDFCCLFLWMHFASYSLVCSMNDGWGLSSSY
jgi:hypothetical protein